MNIIPARQLICPLDQTPLSREESRWCCGQGHSFDIARQGYVNLMPVQHKKSRDPGDSREMIAARSRWLGHGHYAPIADMLADVSQGLLRPGDQHVVMDAGCGDGYYLDTLATALAPVVGEAAMIGFDISKWAVAAAAKRRSDFTWLVASNVRPPVAPASVDLILCLFGFPCYEPFAGVMKPGGHLVLADPGPEHLIELREVIYPEVRRKAPSSLDEAEAAGFKLIDSRTLRYTLRSVDQACLQDLMVMTPHLYRASSEGKAAASALASLDLTVEVVFRVLELS